MGAVWIASKRKEDCKIPPPPSSHHLNFHNQSCQTVTDGGKHNTSDAKNMHCDCENFNPREISTSPIFLFMLDVIRVLIGQRWVATVLIAQTV